MFSLLSGALHTALTPPPLTLLILGVDSSGKTSTLESLKPVYSPSSVAVPLAKIRPTMGANSARMMISSAPGASQASPSPATYQCTFYDPSGSPGSRSAWSHYYEDADGVLFVVSTGQPGRMDEVGLLFNSVADEVDCPIAVLVNVAGGADDEGGGGVLGRDGVYDMARAVMEEWDVASYLGRVKVFLGDARNGFGGKKEGAGEAAEWLCGMRSRAGVRGIGEDAVWGQEVNGFRSAADGGAP